MLVIEFSTLYATTGMLKTKISCRDFLRRQDMAPLFSHSSWIKYRKISTFAVLARPRLGIELDLIYRSTRILTLRLQQFFYVMGEVDEIMYLLAKTPELLPDFNTQVSVSTCFIEMHGGKFLVLQRGKAEDQPGTWCIPGGKVESGESAKAAVAREVQEETGIALVSASISHRLTRFVRIPGWDYDLHVFHVNLPVPPKVAINPREHSTHLWVTPAQAKKLSLIAIQREIIELVYEGRNEDIIQINPQLV